MGGTHPHPAHSTVITDTAGHRHRRRHGNPLSKHHRKQFSSTDSLATKGWSPLTWYHRKKFSSADCLADDDSPPPSRADTTTTTTTSTTTPATSSPPSGGVAEKPQQQQQQQNPRPKLRGVGLKRQNDDVPVRRRRESMASVTSELRPDEEDNVLFDYVANSIVGKDFILNGPYGQRKVLYLDYIASGKPLTFIEEYISKEVLPTYANTHTTTSATARQTTLFRNEARAIIYKTTNASEDDVVIFTGNGVTGAVHKVLHALNFTESPVVFIGPYEHHSNILPWREMNAEVIRIPQTADGLVDLEALEKELKKWAGCGRRLVGSFSAASNVTGILVDTVAVSILLHRYGALALWDYATAAPYVRLDMNPVVSGEDKALAYKDVIFVSPHKFVGGVDTPGVLIAKKHVFVNEVPHHCGGGTVRLVRQTGHRYLQNLEEREEGGTPSIVGAIRAGLIFQLKDAIGPERIMQREKELFRRAREYWTGVPNLIILGNMGVERLPVFSFLVKHPTTGYYLHHNFVACLLNDLFGIQARGGCACAGPYAMDLLGISEEMAMRIEELLTAETKEDRERKSGPRHSFGDAQREIFKPGFTRLNLPYFLNEDQVEFVLKAVTLVAEHGWKLLPQYKFNPRTGEWKHELSQESKLQRHLDQLSYGHGFLEVQLPKRAGQKDATLPESLQDCLHQARLIFAEAENNVASLPDQSHLFEDFTQTSRWFMLPSEASEVLHAFSQIKDVHPAINFIVPNQNATGNGGGHHHHGQHHHQQHQHQHQQQQQQSAQMPDSSTGSSSSSGSRGSRVTVTSLGSTLSGQNGGKEKKSPRHVRKIKVNGYQPPAGEDPASTAAATSPPVWKY